MLRKMLLLAMGLAFQIASSGCDQGSPKQAPRPQTSTVSAQSGTAPAEKVQPASDNTVGDAVKPDTANSTSDAGAKQDAPAAGGAMADAVKPDAGKPSSAEPPAKPVTQMGDASNPFGDDAAKPEAGKPAAEAPNPFDAAADDKNPDTAPKLDAKKPEPKPADGDNPFDVEPSVKAGVKAAEATAPATGAKPAAGESDASDPFGGGTVLPAKPVTQQADAPPQKRFNRAGKAATSAPAAAQQKSAPTKHRLAVDAKEPLRLGEKAILDAMEEKATLDFEETPLTEVIDYLQDKHHIPIWLDSSALKEAGVDEGAPVTCRISGIPLRSALEIMLDDLQLKWAVRHDVLMITSSAKAESDEYLVVKIYDVSDLLVETGDQPFRGNGLPTIEASEPPSPRTNGIGFQGGAFGGGMMGGMGGGAMGGGGMGGMGGGMMMGGGSTGGGGMGGGGFFAVPPEANSSAMSPSSGPAAIPNVIGYVPIVGTAGTQPLSQDATPSSGDSSVATDRNGTDNLADLIKSVVAPRSWQDTGGNGTILPHGHLFCITQSFNAQCEVQAFLTDLRAKRRAAPTLVVELQWLWLDGGQYEQLLGGATPSSDGRRRLDVDAKALDLIGRKAPGFRANRLCQRATRILGLGRPPLDHRQHAPRGRQRRRL